MESYIILTER